jgi:hypothetical protein
MKPGIAMDDGAAVHFRDDAVSAIVTARPDANAYRVVQKNGVVEETILDGERVKV